MLKRWEEIPKEMQTEEVRYYYEILSKKKNQLFLKRIFDCLIGIIGIILFSPILLILAILIKCDSKGPVFFRQTRVTQYGQEFKIFKFRTMVVNAEKLGSAVTVGLDPRITRMGNLIRKTRLDELPQLINVIKGEMSFVGTRPEVPKYVKEYTPEMLATLLMPAGITSRASIQYKDEDQILQGAIDVDEVYIREVLPRKMQYNLNYLEEFSIFTDWSILLNTVIAVFGEKIIKRK